MARRHKIEWKTFLIQLYNKSFDTDVFNHASQVAFYFAFSLFPLLLVLVSILGLVIGSTDGLKQELFEFLGRLMPSSAFELVQTTLNEIAANSSGGTLTFGILVTIWSATAGVDSLRSSLNAVYELKEKRAWWSTKLQSLVMTMLFVLLIGGTLVGLTAGWQLLQYGFGKIGFEVTSPIFLAATQWIVLLIFLLFVSAVIYSWLPCYNRFKWRWISPGALVAILLWILLSAGFKLYLQYFNTYNKVYGSLGAVIILMLWMYLTALAILTGGAINSVISTIRSQHVTASDKEFEGNK